MLSEVGCTTLTVLAHVSSFYSLLRPASLLSVALSSLAHPALPVAVLTRTPSWLSLLLSLSRCFISRALPVPDVHYRQSLSYRGFKTRVLRMIKKSQGLRADFKRGDEGPAGMEVEGNGCVMMTIYSHVCVHLLH